MAARTPRFRMPQNGFGGLTVDGDYEIQVAGDRLPPAPWANVIANPHGGFVVTERGGGFTWAENSYFYRLTPWHNDPVSDPVSEVVYLQDDETGDLWSATPGPVRTATEFTVRHGPGESNFAQQHTGISDRTDARHGRRRGGEAHPAPGDQHRHATRGDSPSRPSSSGPSASCASTPSTRCARRTIRSRQTLFARNIHSIPRFAGWTAFHAISEPVIGHTGSRREFLGRNGTSASPAALEPGGLLQGITGAGIDPCAALQVRAGAGPGRDPRDRRCCSAPPTARPRAQGADRELPRRGPGAGGAGAERRRLGPSGSR